MKISQRSIVRFKFRYIVAPHVFVACLSAITYVGSPCEAQTTPQEWWNQIKKADTRITACRVGWSRVMTTKPQARHDTEKQAQRAKEQTRQQGGNANEVKSAAEGIRAYMQQQSKGYTQTQTLSFARAANTIRCDVLSGAPVLAGSTSDPVVAHYIDFYDGKNAVTLAGVGKELPVRGQLTQDKTQILPHSAPAITDVQFLVGAPVTQQFAPENSSLRESPEGTLILEKRIKTPRLLLLRLTLSKEHLRPIAFEGIDVSFAPDNVVKIRRTATGYRRYADGVWFPSKITTDRGFGGEEDKLIKAEFNEAVDPMELRLPPGTLIADMRFGDKKTIGYKLENGKIRTDDEVYGFLQRSS